MLKIAEICTTYKVLEIREPFGADALNPIVIICEKSETKERRRIEVYRNHKEDYLNAQMLIVGDTFSICEWCDDGRRVLKELIVYFREEELAKDEF